MLLLARTARIVTLGAGLMKWRKLENFSSVTALVENMPSRKEFNKYYNPNCVYHSCWPILFTIQQFSLFLIITSHIMTQKLNIGKEKLPRIFLNIPSVTKMGKKFNIISKQLYIKVSIVSRPPTRYKYSYSKYRNSRCRIDGENGESLKW